MLVQAAKNETCEWDIEVKHLGNGRSEAYVPCYCCKKMVTVVFGTKTYGQALELLLIKSHVCHDCQDTGAKEKKEKEAASIEAMKSAASERDYEKRLIESQLAVNKISWDSTHPGANNELFAWAQKHQLESILMTGETGLCKTRILQHFGSLELEAGHSVFYSPASLMLNKISSTYFKSCDEGDALLEKIFCFDLLIIDDLGKEIGTNPQIGRLWDIIDRRYIRYNQEKDVREGKIIPLYAKNLNRAHGWKLWVSTNLGVDDIFNKYEKNFNRAGDPLLSRLNNMCHVWEAPENRELGIK